MAESYIIGSGLQDLESPHGGTMAVYFIVNLIPYLSVFRTRVLSVPEVTT